MRKGSPDRRYLRHPLHGCHLGTELGGFCALQRDCSLARPLGAPRPLWPRPPKKPRPRCAEDSGSLGPARGAGIRGPARARRCLAPRARWGRRAPGGERSGRAASPHIRVPVAAPALAAAQDPSAPRAPPCHLQDTLSGSQHRLLAVPAQPRRRSPAASALRPPP